jgi:hypothetical protein
MTTNIPDFVPASGASIVSRNIMDGTAPLRWLVRDAAANPQDNGWRFFSAIDDEAYLADPANLQVASFTSVAAVEPAIIPILFLPEGTDLELVRDDDGLHFIDSTIGEAISIP